MLLSTVKKFSSITAISRMVGYLELVAKSQFLAGGVFRRPPRPPPVHGPVTGSRAIPLYTQHLNLAFMGHVSWIVPES